MLKISNLVKNRNGTYYLRFQSNYRETRLSLWTKDLHRARDTALKLLLVHSTPGIDLEMTRKIIKAVTMKADGSITADTAAEMAEFIALTEKLRAGDALDNLKKAPKVQPPPTTPKPVETPTRAFRSLLEDFTAYKEHYPTHTIVKGVEVPLSRDEVKTIKERQKAIADFLSWYGDGPSLLVPNSKATDYRNKLQKTLTLNSQQTTPSSSSVNKKLSALRMFFKFCMSQDPDYHVRNPFDGVKYEGQKTKSKAESYLPFTPDDIAQIFSKATYGDYAINDTFKYVPLLMLYCPMNPKELFSLKTEHVQLEHGFYVMPIYKSKTTNRIRTIPIPPLVLDLGFKDYILNRRKLGKEFLFDHDRNQLSKRFNDYLDKLEIKKPKRLYSFRSTAINAMHDVGVPDAVRECFAGHGKESKVHFNNYIKPSLNHPPSASKVRCYIRALKATDLYKLSYFGHMNPKGRLFNEIEDD